MQKSLFTTSAPPADKPPERPRYRLALERYEVKDPWGKPDKKGVYFWQKMQAEIDKLPEPMQEQFNHLTYGANPEQLDQFEKCLRMLRNATPGESIDFDVSRGKLKGDE